MKRENVSDLEEVIRQLRQYAWELHGEVKPDYDAMMAERRTKVRRL